LIQPEIFNQTKRSKKKIEKRIDAAMQHGLFYSFELVISSIEIDLRKNSK
jgi:hypothetical protein